MVASAMYPVQAYRPHNMPGGPMGLSGMAPGVRVGQNRGPWQPGLLPTLSGVPDAPMQTLAEYYDMDGFQIADVLRQAYRLMYGQEAPAGGALYWLRWLDTVRYKTEWKNLLEEHSDYHWGSGVRPSIWYGIWKGLERNVKGLISGIQTYPEINEPINATLFASGTSLTYQQWVEVSNSYVDWAAKNIAKGLLSINHLDAIIQGLNHEDIDQRRFAVFHAAPQASDEERASWSMYMKKIGYSRWMDKWRAWSMEGWRRETNAIERYSSALAFVETGLSYASGKVVVDKFMEGLDTYFRDRAEIINFFNETDAALASGSFKMTAAERAEYDSAKAEWLKNDQKAYNLLSPAGVWDGQTAPGQLRGLGAIQIVGAVVAATLLAGLLGLVAWQLSLKERAFTAQKSAYHRSQEALDGVEAQARAERDATLREVNRKLAAGEIDEATAAAEKIAAERKLKSELATLADKRAEIPPPQQPPGLFSGAGNVMGGLGLTVAALVAGAWLIRRRQG